MDVDTRGIADAFEVLREEIVPWRRKNAQRKANLENAQREAEIHRLNAETRLNKAKEDRERSAIESDRSQAELALSQAKKNEAEAALLLAQADKARAEAEKERAALKRGQIELALQIVEKYAPDVDGTKKIEHVVRLVPVLDRLTSSPIQLLPPSTSKTPTPDKPESARPIHSQRRSVR